MKASEANFLEFMRGTRQFVIPIYQRTYSWTLKQCAQLWQDIVHATTDDSVSGHFVGSIVYIEKGLYHVSSVPQLLVIDGQQRLTTLSLILAALRNAIEAEGNEAAITPRRLSNYYLYNAEEDGDLHYKLMLTQSDRATLMSVVDGDQSPDNPSKRILENFSFFNERIQQSGLRPSDIFRGIQKLIIVDIALNRDYDNPQLIFESLNSTGLELSQADLIRNYILMGLEPKEQDHVYSHHWFPMEQRFGQDSYSVRFDPFMRDFLTIKTGQIPNIRDVYEEFKTYAQSNKTGTIEEIVGEIHRFSRYYVNIALDKEPDPELREAFQDINALRVDVAYPLLLELYEKYAYDELARSDFLQILRLVESYVLRRAICGIPTNSLNKTFANLSKELSSANYLESLKIAFWRMSSYRRFPRDDEFQREFVVKDIYNWTNRRNYLLRKLENHNRKERVNTESYTIEHVLPQNSSLSVTWRSELGENWQEIQRTYLHTVGNLTLTGYNPELSDRPFREKRDMEGGFRDSPIRLNRDLAELERWNENEIQKRASKLANLACQIWPAATPSAESLAALEKSARSQLQGVYTLADHPYITGYVRALYEALRTRILNLDSAVYEEILKLYIAYKTSTNFVDVVPQASGLRLSLNMEFPEIDDPQGRCTDITNLGRWGNGDVEVRFTQLEHLDYIMYLIEQAYRKHTDADN